MAGCGVEAGRAAAATTHLPDTDREGERWTESSGERAANQRARRVSPHFLSQSARRQKQRARAAAVAAAAGRSLTQLFWELKRTGVWTDRNKKSALKIPLGEHRRLKIQQDSPSARVLCAIKAEFPPT